MSLTDITDIASSGLIAASVVGLTFASGIAGMIVRGRLPDRIMTPVAVDVIKLITGLLETMVALVLGLLITSANNVTNTQETELQSRPRTRTTIVASKPVISLITSTA